MQKIWETLGICPADIMVPQERCDLEKWSVVACDQFTSDTEYWKKTEAFVGDAPSTLRVTFPEIYLNDHPAERIEKINHTIKQYMTEGVFREYKEAIFFVRRTLHSGAVRKGLVLAADLECYDYSKGSQSLIRATEGTILDRLPPRMRIRENAPMEFPHIMVLIDDPDKTVIESLCFQEQARVYRTELMQNGGRIEGYLLSDAQQNAVATALLALADPAKAAKKYGVSQDAPVLLYAMGDGNHSLATAKACWERLKGTLSPQERENHPARYALIELVNLHDDSLVFEPIHRIVTGADVQQLLSRLKCVQGGQEITVLYGRERRSMCLSATHELAVGTLQAALDEYLAEHPEASVDYVHEAETVERLSGQEGNIGFLLPPMGKNQLFRSVMLNGVLPRKTFSMGEGCDKRYYLEGRRITK